MAVEIQKSYSNVVPSIGGVGGYVLQSGLAKIEVDGVVTITVEEVTSSVIVSTYHYSDGAQGVITGDVPADIRSDYDATVQFWTQWLENREAALASPQETVIVEGRRVNAPGYSVDQFVASVALAKAARLRTEPARTPGGVVAQNPSSTATYLTSRTSCSCAAGQHGMRCTHRAWVIYLADVKGIDVTKVRTFGLNTRNFTVTIAA